MKTPSRASVVKVLVLLLGISILFMFASAIYFKRNSNALWQIVSEKCIPDMQLHQNPSPCEKVSFTQGYALLKDKVGPRQYLLIPLQRISGIESPKLLDPRTPDFFSSAWQERGIIAQHYGQPINDDRLSLAINSISGRTQDQLHIHISCLRKDIASTLSSKQSELSAQWQSEILLGHTWQVRTLQPQQLDAPGLFIRLANELPDASNQMGSYGMLLSALPDGRLVVLAIKRQWIKGVQGSAEELQDHSCQILN